MTKAAYREKCLFWRMVLEGWESIVVEKHGGMNVEAGRWELIPWTTSMKQREVFHFKPPGPHDILPLARLHHLPLQTAPPTKDQVLRCLRLWGTFSFKTAQADTQLDTALIHSCFAHSHCVCAHSYTHVYTQTCWRKLHTAWSLFAIFWAAARQPPRDQEDGGRGDCSD